jgi:DNA-binding MarR family transcriptional regulator
VTDEQPPDAADLAASLRPSLLRLTRTIRNQRVDTSITLTALAALMTVSHGGPMTPGELAASERVQPPSMTKILAGLEGRGLVSRERHPTDGRQVVISITEAGLALVAEERHARNAWLSTALAQLSADELVLLERVRPLLDKLARL